MQFPRYELVLPTERKRVTPNPRPPRPRPPRPPRRFGGLRRMTPRRRPRPVLEIHQYLELEFAVEERR
jgi:hypothetical protein